MSFYSDQVIRDGAIAYWRLDETSGIIAKDSIGGNDGTISGGVTLGQPGALADSSTAMRFNGVDGKIVSSSTLSYPVACTFEVWFNTINTTGSVGIIGNRFTLLDGIVVIATAANGSGLFVDSYVGGNNVISGVKFISDGIWHHVVWTTNGSIGTIYIDGVQSIQGAQPHVALTEKFQIAYDNFQNKYFDGLVDEVAIYPTALSPSQIANHYGLSKLTNPFGTLINIGVPTPLVQSQIYSLPPRISYITSTAPVEVSLDGNTFIPLTGAEGTGARTGSQYLRSLNSTCSVIAKYRR